MQCSIPSNIFGSTVSSIDVVLIVFVILQ